MRAQSGIVVLPERVGRYEVERVLGAGGMATVLLARDPGGGRHVAVKVLGRQVAGDESFRTRFERETRVVGGLEHPAIVPLYDHGEHEGEPFLVLRYMEGGSLAERLTPGVRRSLADTSKVLNRVAAALDFAHDRGIVHRDIKPANVLFDSQANAYLADFGIARIVADEALTGGGIIGTPRYMSPEQATGRPVTQASDIYGFGCLAYEMLTGHAPFGDVPVDQLIVEQQTREPPPVSGVPPRVSNIIQRTLARDPSMRPVRAADVAIVLAELGTDTVMSEPLGSRTRSSRAKAAAISSIGALGIGAFLVAFAVMNGHREGATSSPMDTEGISPPRTESSVSAPSPSEDPATSAPTTVATPTPTYTAAPVATQAPATTGTGFRGATHHEVINDVLIATGAPWKYGGDCTTAAIGTICSFDLGMLDDYRAFGFGITRSDTEFGTALLSQDETGSWKAVAVDWASEWQEGQQLIVGGTASCLNVRVVPSTGGQVVTCLSRDTAVEITGTATFQEGYIWVPTNYGGWVAARWLCYAAFCPVGEVTAETYVFE